MQTIPQVTMSPGGPQFSQFVQGYWRLSEWQLSTQECLSFINSHLDLGITTVDHAHVYGEPPAETLFGEALKLDLDKNDIIIKRRLSQKIGFLKQEEVKMPSADEVEEYFKNNQSAYLVPKKYTFTHIYFNADKDGKNRALKALNLWKKNKDLPYGDPFLLGKNFSLKTSKEIARSFGEDFSDAIDKAIINDWTGPYESSYGSHLVFVSAVAEEKVPELKEIRSLLISDIQMQQEQDNFKFYLDNLRKEYKVQVNPELIN